jgi:osmoprotectant transport system permease protein
VNWDWLVANRDTLLQHLSEHVSITLAAVALGVVVAFPVGLVAHRWERVYAPVLAVTQVLYTIPSLALFVLLIGVFGLGQLPVVLGLTVYALVILVRNLVEGLRAVPAEVSDAATAMGYRPLSRTLVVELPLALPALVAGLRLAVVSTVSLVSVGALIGTGGLGQLFIHGFQVDNPIEVWAGIVLTAALALVLDLLVVAAGRAAAPWSRAVR